MAPGLRRVNDSRHAWAHEGYAHIEVGRMNGGDSAVEFAERIEKALEANEGVSWAAYNDVLGRVVVGFDPARTTLAVLVDEVRRVERQVIHRRRIVPIPDIDPPVANAVALGADLLAIGGGLAGRVMRLPRLPAELAALTAAVEVLPRIGKRLRASLGRVRTDLGLALTSSAIGAASQTVGSSAADAALRIVLLAETAAHRDAQSRRAEELCRDAETSRAHPVEPVARPAPLPDGPIERYAQRVSMVTVLAAAALLPVAGGRRRAARALAVGTPRAARLGREAYAGQLGRALARRGVIVRDPAALRRLDRIDTVVVDAPVLMTGRYVVSHVVPIRGSAEEARERAAELLSDGGLSAGTRRAPQRRGGWALNTPSRLRTPIPETAAASMNGNGSGRGDVLALTHGARWSLCCGSRPNSTRSAPHCLPPRARSDACSSPVLRRGSSNGCSRTGPSRAVLDSPAPCVRLQRKDGGVALVAARNDVALAAADCGIGISTSGDRRPPWGAHLLCGPDLESAWLVLEAATLARRVSRRGSRIALLGSVAGALLGLVRRPAAGRTARAGRRRGSGAGQSGPGRLVRARTGSPPTARAGGSRAVACAPDRRGSAPP